MQLGVYFVDLPNFGKQRWAIKRVAYGLQTSPVHLRALRASASCICAKILT
jgi:hypothetical protein